jgi:uncharacterized protein YeaO (DUF488 family)
MPIRTRRWNDPRLPDDGLRLLVSRYRPRALPKDEETWEIWWKELGPSEELHAAFYGKSGAPITFEEYARRYAVEMQSQRAKIESLARHVASGETVTLLCSSACTDPARCHRTILARLVEEAVSR